MQLRSILFALAILAAVVTPADAQVARKPGMPADVVRLAYDFSPGESVTYRVITTDSLVLWGMNLTQQTAERTQHVTITCDSVTRDGFVLTLRTDAYAARERRDSLPVVTRTTHPWLAAPITVLMARDGRRVRMLGTVDSSALSPTGPFHPMLFPYLGEEMAHIGSAEIFELNHQLVDNAVPPAISRGSVFRTVAGQLDTFGLSTVDITFAETGRATYEPPTGITTAAVISGGSRHFFSPLLGFPVAGRADAMYNLTLTSPRGAEATGRQIVSVRYSMVDPLEAELPVAPNR